MDSRAWHYVCLVMPLWKKLWCGSRGRGHKCVCVVLNWEKQAGSFPKHLLFLITDLMPVSGRWGISRLLLPTGAFGDHMNTLVPQDGPVESATAARHSVSGAATSAVQWQLPDGATAVSGPLDWKSRLVGPRETPQIVRFGFESRDMI